MDKLNQFLKSSLDAYERLKEAEGVMARQKEELSISYNVEANLRLQLTRIQDRVVTMQRELNKMRDLQAQNRNLEKAIDQQGEKIRFLVSVVEEQRKKVTQKVSSVSVERNLSIQVCELQKRFEEQDNVLNLVRIENQTVFNQKDAEIQQLRQQLQTVTKEKTQAIWDKQMMENSVDRMQLLNSKKIEELNEKIIKMQTAEKPSAWDKTKHVTWADAVRHSVQDSEISSQVEENSPPCVESRQPIFIPKTPRKTQAPLAVHTVKDDSNQPKKKRLYSSNSNHFIA